MKVITLMNEKGGVGKTTFSMHIAAGLAIEGYRVLYVDTDPQANSTQSFGIQKRGSFYDLCVRPEEATWDSLLRQVHPDVFSPPGKNAAGELYLIPGNEETRNIANMTSDYLVVKRRLMEVQDVFDFCIIDTSPTPSLLHSSITVASDYIIIPTDCEKFSAFQGLPNTIGHIENIHKQLIQANLDGANLLGIIPNKFRQKTVLHNEAINILFKKYGEKVWQPYPMRIAIAEVQARDELLYAAAPTHAATGQMWKIVHQILKEVAVHG